MEIDIRKNTKEEVTRIRFSDSGNSASRLVKFNYVVMEDCHGCSDPEIRSKEDAINLIKALEKAIELGWFE